MTYNIKEIVKYNLKNLGVVLEVYENFSECFKIEIESSVVNSVVHLIDDYNDYHPIDDSVKMSQCILELCFEFPEDGEKYPCLEFTFKHLLKFKD